MLQDIGNYSNPANTKFRLSIKSCDNIINTILQVNRA